MYSTLEIHYNPKKIENYYVSSKCNNPVLKLCIISFDIIKRYENTGPNIRK